MESINLFLRLGFQKLALFSRSQISAAAQVIFRRAKLSMAKSKNHTAHNQSHKAHRNGIKKPKQQRNSSTKGMNPKFLRNQRYARKHNKQSGDAEIEE
ncbi:Large ribosomal subunit protein eL29y [Salvia divinorum]|uniref:60S ribosomal protein L29 n=1 Tax=Salvia divinorum TaxID=28513 RepID=A0ABD1FWT6_SALDI